VLDTATLVRSDNVFFVASGITDGELLRGARYTGLHATTHSLVMRSTTKTVRWIEARHDRDSKFPQANRS
jgi:fructose-1,6-bisphosphatase II